MIDLSNIPQGPGVYIMLDSDGQILYIGKAKILRRRVLSYFRPCAKHSSKIAKMVAQVNSLEYRQTTSEFDALLLESRLIKQHQPKYNTLLKDSKSCLYFALSMETFPRALLTRESECLHPISLELIGPFLDASALQRSFKTLQKIFLFRTCHLNIQENSPYIRPCLLGSIHYCSAPCGHRISALDYQTDIAKLRSLLNGDHTLIERLRKEMEAAAFILDFEKAAKLRDQIYLLERLEIRGKVGDFMPGQLLHANVQKSLEQLQHILKLPTIPRVVEGMDISHHQGSEAVGSMVTFIDGMPYKEGYRQYRIQSSTTQNDLAMLQEVVYRRFCGQDKGRDTPDILLIDGGKAQLRAVMHSLDQIAIKLPAVLALAKKEEKIYVPQQDDPLDLPDHSQIHHLLCYVRDEAHRFAQRYHHCLQRKKIQMET